MVLTMQGLLAYSDSFGVPRSLSRPFIKDFIKWSLNNGDEWTVDHVKRMKVFFIHIFAGSPIQVDGIPFFHNLTGYMKGFVHWGLQKKNFVKLIQLLQIYSIHFSPSVTPKQEKKFLDGVNAPNVQIPESIINGLSFGVKDFLRRPVVLEDPKPFGMYIPSGNKRSPHPSGKMSDESSSVLPQLAYLCSTRLGWDLISHFPNIFNPALAGIDIRDPRDADVTDFPNSVGTIGFIQEPGFKLRAVANPGRIFQHVLRPLGDFLFNFLRKLPWDCTHDQSRPFRIISEVLDKSGYCASVDLSSATDYFPLDLQLEVLKHLSFRKDYIDLFRILSRSDWIYNREKFIRWNKGQPLGLFPSFPLFALTHGLLLYHLNDYCHNDKFFILGDDVVILDSLLYQKYISTLSILDCPISELKSIFSNKLAEFGGKLITSHVTISQLKWRTPSDNSFLDIVRNIGPRAIRLLRHRQRRMAKLMFEIPDFFGGLGFNPKGIPLEDRVARYYELFDKKPNISYLMSYDRIIQNHNYYDREKFLSPLHFVIAEGGVPDLGTLAYITKYLPHLVRWSEVMGTNLYSIDPYLDLPIQAGVSRLTTLERLERILL